MRNRLGQINLSLLLLSITSLIGFTAETGAVRARSVVEKHHSSKSLDEWLQSGMTPAALFRNTEMKQSLEAWKALCDDLSQLPDADLPLFSDEVSRPELQSQLSCSASIQSRIRRYWAGRQKTLITQFRSSKRIESLSPLPSTEKEVNTSTGPSFVRGELKAGEIALTFDDGPHPTRTGRILDILASYGVRATFFELGENAYALPEISRAAAVSGHSVGSHTWSHPNLPKLEIEHAKAEITSGRDAVAAASGTSIPFFRFPYGSSNAQLKKFVKELPMANFFWTMDSLDWKLLDPVELMKNILAELDREKGGIILFHDIHEQTVMVLPLFLEELRARGYTTVVFIPR